MTQGWSDSRPSPRHVIYASRAYESYKGRGEGAPPQIRTQRFAERAPSPTRQTKSPNGCPSMYPERDRRPSSGDSKLYPIEILCIFDLASFCQNAPTPRSRAAPPPSRNASRPTMNRHDAVMQPPRAPNHAARSPDNNRPDAGSRESGARTAPWPGAAALQPERDIPHPPIFAPATPSRAQKNPATVPPGPLRHDPISPIGQMAAPRKNIHRAGHRPTRNETGR